MRWIFSLNVSKRETKKSFCVPNKALLGTGSLIVLGLLSCRRLKTGRNIKLQGTRFISNSPESTIKCDTQRYTMVCTIGGTCPCVWLSRKTDSRRYEGTKICTRRSSTGMIFSSANLLNLIPSIRGKRWEEGGAAETIRDVWVLSLYTCEVSDRMSR